MAELLIRAGHDDHLVIGDLLTPTGGAVALRPPIDRLVADAQTAARLPSLAESANLAGVPYLVDPVTYLLQGPTDPDDAWVKRVPFGASRELLPSDFSSARVEALAADVVEFELKKRATAIVAPYLYAHSPDDPAFTASLQLLLATRRHMSRNAVNLPRSPCSAAPGSSSRARTRGAPASIASWRTRWMWSHSGSRCA